jgi:D-3-phosphoglycerate dehydrogenase
VKILITEPVDSVLQEILKKNGFQCRYQPDITFEELKTIAKNFNGLIIRSKFSLQKDFLSANKHLKFIGRLGSGMENIDTEFAEELGIHCLNSPEGNRDALGEHALGMLLALMNNMLRADSEIRRGIWQRNENRGHEIHGKTIGIIGYGNMGSAFAQRLTGFDAQVIAYDKYKSGFSNEFVREVGKTELFEKTDILSVHVPQNQETMFMIDNEFVQKFSKPIYLINTARGKIVKTSDLVENLKSGKIIGAALDVLEYEKSHFENLYAENLPSDFQYLIESEKVILTPHIAGRTFESEKKLAFFLTEKILNLFPKNKTL